MSDDASQPSNHADTSDEETVAWLAFGRSKRATAGNRLSALIGQEEAAGDDDVNLLFEEQEDEPDEEFEEEAGSDEEGGDSSTSDEEDEQADDELEGEKQLRKEEREKQRAVKRKADQKFIRPRPPAKRVRITEPDVKPVEQESRPNKRRKRTEKPASEGEGQVRTSTRKLAVLNKERTKANLRETEAKRARQQVVMEAARERREAEKKGPMTQEDKLREAAKVERQNSRSLSRWEEMEAERLKKQKQKLEALQNRKIEGPFIRWWSGPAEWRGEKLVRVGPKKLIQEVDHAGKGGEAEKQKVQANPSLDGIANGSSTSKDGVDLAVSNQSNSTHLQPPPSSSANNSFLDGIELYASMPASSNVPAPSAPTSTTNSLMTPYPIQQPVLPQPSTALQQFRSGAPVTSTSAMNPLPPAISLPPAPPPPPITALRSTVTFENFDPVVKRSHEAQARILFGLRNSEQAKLAKPPPPTLCAITAQLAAYRDPLTGLPYRGRSEFQRLRRLPGLGKGGHGAPDGSDQAKWSNVLGAWIGTGSHAAHGVPESFLTGVAPPEPKKDNESPATASEGLQVKPEGDVAAAG